MNEMNPKERIVNALTGQPVDRLPFSPFLAYVWEHFPTDVQARGQLAFHHDIGADPLWRGAPCPVSVAFDGVETRVTEEGSQTHVETITPVGTLRSTFGKTDAAGVTVFPIEHPLKCEADYKTQLWIEEHTRFEAAPQVAADFLQGDGREGLALGMLCFRGKTAFQTLVEGYCGTEELTRALYLEYPDTVLALYEAMKLNNLKCARLAAESAYDWFLTFEDSSTQNYSPTMYEQFIAPEIKSYCEMLATCGKKYVQHACGHVRHLVPLMIECGVAAVESLSPPPTGNLPLKECRALCDCRAPRGNKMGIIGGIEPLTFLNTPYEKLREYVEQVVADGLGVNANSQGGPFLLANSDSCPPGVTVEKFKLVADVAREVSAECLR